jgi:hypothetical protein
VSICGVQPAPLEAIKASVYVSSASKVLATRYLHPHTLTALCFRRAIMAANVSICLLDTILAKHRNRTLGRLEHSRLIFVLKHSVFRRQCPYAVWCPERSRALSPSGAPRESVLKLRRWGSDTTQLRNETLCPALHAMDGFEYLRRLEVRRLLNGSFAGFFSTIF